jgi:hypothetical protein
MMLEVMLQIVCAACKLDNQYVLLWVDILVVLGSLRLYDPSDLRSQSQIAG